MKYKYTIFAQSEWEEDQLLAKLKSIGLDNIFVERFRDIDSIVADQNNFIDENFDAKLSKLLATDIVPTTEMKMRLAELVAKKEHKSMRMLFSSIYEVGVEMDLPDFRIGRIMCDAAALLN